MKTILPDEWRDLPASTGRSLRPVGTMWHEFIPVGLWLHVAGPSVVHAYQVSGYLLDAGHHVVEVSSFVRSRPASDEECALAAVAEEDEGWRC